MTFRPTKEDLLEMQIATMLSDIGELPTRHLITVLVAGLDELLARANGDDTYGEVAKEERGIGQIKSRAELVLSFLDARRPSNVVYLGNVG